MRKMAAILMLSIVLLSAGCGTAESDPNRSSGESLDIIEVDLIAPEKTSPGEEITIEAKITQGEEEVADADSVKFEIWNKEDEANSVMIPYESRDGGTYRITYTVPSDGVYVVQVHVDARNLHVMPLSEFLAEE